MLAALSRRALSFSRPLASTLSCRAFSVRPKGVPQDQGVMPESIEQGTGIARKEEVYNTAFEGAEFYDRDALQAHEEGTKANPIPVYSAEPERYVGVSVEDDSFTRWFLLKEGELAYDPLTQNYFALRVIADSSLEEAVAAAEKTLQ